MNVQMQKPTNAFIGASWVALLLGTGAYFIGLWNTDAMTLNDKGYYFTIMMFGLFASVSLQKSVRDKLEGIPVTGLYQGICWFALLLSLVLMAVGLWQANFTDLEKGFYAMAYLLSLYATITVQKNVRDLALFADNTPRDSEDDDFSFFRR